MKGIAQLVLLFVLNAESASSDHLIKSEEAFKIECYCYRTEELVVYQYSKGKVAEQEGYCYPVALYSLFAETKSTAMVTQMIIFRTHVNIHAYHRPYTR